MTACPCKTLIKSNLLIRPPSEAIVDWRIHVAAWACDESNTNRKLNSFIKLCRQCIIIRWYVQKYPDPDTFFRRSYGEFCLLVGGGVFKGLLSVFHDGNLKNKNVTGGLGLRTLSLRSEHKSTDPAFYIHCTIEKIYLHSSSKR